MLKLDRYLLLHYPILWESRIHWVLAGFIPYTCICLLMGSSQSEERDFIYLSLFFTFCSFLGASSYIYFLTRYNHFKWFGQHNFLTPVLKFTLLAGCFLMIFSGTALSAVPTLSEAGKDNKELSSFLLAYWIYPVLTISLLVSLFRMTDGRSFLIGTILCGVFWAISTLFLSIFSLVFKDEDILLYLSILLSLFALVLYPFLPKNIPSGIRTGVLIYGCVLVPYYIPILVVKDMARNLQEMELQVVFSCVGSALLTLLLVGFYLHPVLSRNWGKDN